MDFDDGKVVIIVFAKVGKLLVELISECMQEAENERKLSSEVHKRSQMGRFHLSMVLISIIHFSNG